MDEKKWSIGIGATVKDKEVLPEFKIKDQIDENSDVELKISKEKVYAEYNLKF